MNGSEQGQCNPSTVKHILLLVQNLSVPFDRRVWREAKTLKALGFKVSVISPKGKGYDTESFFESEGVQVWRYSLESDNPGMSGFISEYFVSFFKTFWLALRIYTKSPFRVIHTANPPDTFFAIAIVFKVLFRVKFIYDQHDLCPELFQEKFHRKHHMLLHLQYALEYLTYRTADAVIATNLSLKDVAIRRGQVQRQRVFVVRNGPDADFAKDAGRLASNNGFKYLCSYVGVMGEQDGLEYIIKSADVIFHKYTRRDVRFLLVGDGEELERLKAMTQELGVNGIVQFTGRIPDAELKAILNSSDVCLAPDPANNFNNWHTMNKIMDYMMFGKPIVSFDLKESRVSAGGAALYVESNDAASFAKAIIGLLDNPTQRNRLGEIGRERIAALTWDHSQRTLEQVYKTVI